MTESWQDSPFITDITDLFEKFLEIEQPLFEKEVNGFKYWHFIRFHVFNEVLHNKGLIEKVNLRKNTSVWEIIRLSFFLLINAFKFNILKDLKQTDIVFINSSNKVKYSNSFIDPYTDILRSNLTWKSSVWEDQKRWAHTESENVEDLFYFDILHLKIFLAALFLNDKKEEIDSATDYLIEYFQNLDFNVNKRELFRLIQRAYRFNLYLTKPIEKLLKKKEVKVLILVNHYDPLKMVVTKIARGLGIHVVELQHGSMSRYNIGYNLLGSTALDTLPHEIWTFGSFWNESVRIKNRGVQLISTGSPYTEKVVCKQPKAAEHSKIRVLFLSQWTVAKKFEETALALTEQLDPEKYEIWYKFHPGEYNYWKSSYSDLFCKSNIQKFEDEDIYSLFNESDILVGVYSTSLIEGLYLGKPLILLETYGIHFFAGLIKRGVAVLAQNGPEAVGAVRNIVFPYEMCCDIEEFWSPDPLKNMQDRLKELLACRKEINA